MVYMHACTLMHAAGKVFLFNPFSKAKRHLRNIKGSEQREVKGLRKGANEKYMNWTVVINIFLFIVDLDAL
jgi:hypothetical protein